MRSEPAGVASAWSAQHTGASWMTHRLTVTYSHVRRRMQSMLHRTHPSLLLACSLFMSGMCSGEIDFLYYFFPLSSMIFPLLPTIIRCDFVHSLPQVFSPLVQHTFKD